MLLEQYDGLPASRLEARIDAVGFEGNFIEELAVALDVRAARRADLNERKPPLVGGIDFQKTFNAAKALQDALGVVHTIHTDAQQGSFDAELRAQGGTLAAGISRFVDGQSRLLKGHADGIGPYQGHVALAIDGETVPLRQCLDGAIHG